MTQSTIRSRRALVGGAGIGLVASQLAFGTIRDLWCLVRLSFGYLC